MQQTSSRQGATALADAAGTFFRKAVKSLKLRGLSGTVRQGFDRSLQGAGRKPSRPPPDDSVGNEFDREHGVDTRRTADPGWLGRLASMNWIYGQAYHPAPIEQVQRVFNELPSEFRTATFIDIGSGKGRIVLLASMMPFRRVIGVEYDAVLHQTAITNVAAFERAQKDRIELLCLDAAEFRFPAEPFVAFFHHPFDRPMFEVVCRNLLTAYGEHHQPICIVYFDPIARAVFDENPAFELYAERQAIQPGEVSYAIYCLRAG